MTFTALLHMWALSLAKCFDVLLGVNNLGLYSSHSYLHCQHSMCRQKLLMPYSCIFLQDGGFTAPCCCFSKGYNFQNILASFTKYIQRFSLKN